MLDFNKISMNSIDELFQSCSDVFELLRFRSLTLCPTISIRCESLYVFFFLKTNFYSIFSFRIRNSIDFNMDSSFFFIA